MKKIMFLTGITLLTLSFSCTKIKQLANINLNIPYSAQVTVPTVQGYTTGQKLPPGGLALPFPATGIPTNSQQTLAQYNVSSSKIVSVYLQSLSIQIIAPNNQNFDFLDTIQLYISVPLQPEVLVAYEYNIPKGQNTLTLTPVADVNLKNYFLADTMYFRLYAHINAIPASGTQLNISSNFHLLANPLD